MSFIRPELAARLRRWREPIVWGGAAAVGLWLSWSGWQGGRPLAFAAGLLLLAVAAGLLAVALRRARFRRPELEAGVVTLTEARLGYFGPHDGGFLDLDTLTEVEILTTGRAAAWRLTAEDGTTLLIPFGARGAEALVDALARLPGLDLDRAHRAARRRVAGRVPVWTRAGRGALDRLP